MSRYARPTSLSYLGPGPMTPAVKWIIWANVAVFVARIIYPRLAEFLGLIPEAVIEHRWIWQPVTYMFVHEGLTHIPLNSPASGCLASSSSAGGGRSSS